MISDEAASAYQRLFTAFPQLREWLARVDDPKATYAIWCGVLAGVDTDDVAMVVDRLIYGDDPMPEAYERDKLPQMIRRAASKIRSERNDREKTTGYQMTAREAKTASDRFPVAMRKARALGVMVRDGKLPKEENDIHVDELIQWSEREGELPECLTN